MLAMELTGGKLKPDGVALSIVLPVFRSLAVSWVEGRYPVHDKLPAVASLAASGASGFTVADAAVFGDAGQAAIWAAETVFVGSDDAANAAFQAVTWAATAAAMAPADAATWDDAKWDDAKWDAVHSGIWEALGTDATRIENGTEPDELAGEALWTEKTPDWFHSHWDQLKLYLIGLDPDWQTWTYWYEARRDGRLTYHNSPKQNEQIEIALATIDYEVWREGPKAVFVETRRLEKEILGEREPGEKEPGGERLRARLSAVASPEPQLSANGRLDAGANETYDRPIVDDDLATLPVRQRSLIRSIQGSFSQTSNAPKILKSSFSEYDDELAARGTQPIVGVLRDHAEIIRAEAEARDAGEWITGGLKRPIERFLVNNDLLLEHFPLDEEREAIYRQAEVYEDEATGDAFAKPFREMLAAVKTAHEHGLTTDEFLRIIEKRKEFADILATLPPRDQADIDDEQKPISAKKRAILQNAGFIDKALDRAGKASKIADSESGKALMGTLKDVGEAIWEFIKTGGS